MNAVKPQRSGLILSAAVLMCTLLIMTVHWISEPTIIAAQQKQLDKLLDNLLPEKSANNRFKDNVVLVKNEALGTPDAQRVYRAELNGEPSGAIITAVSTMGYSGDITLLIGIEYNGTIHAVRVLSHSETPGLGDVIEASKSDWIFKFNRLPTTALTSAYWAVKKNGGEFDRITGATITSNAVIKAVEKASNWYRLNRDSLHSEKSLQHNSKAL